MKKKSTRIFSVRCEFFNAFFNKILKISLLGMFLLLLAFNSKAQVQATGGSGLYKNNIYWLNFTGLNLASGGTKTFNFVVNGITITTIIDQVSITGANGAGTPTLIPYISGTYFEDRLNFLYNIGGTGTSNTLVNAIRTSIDGADAVFRIRTYASINGQPADVGLVFGNAESDAPAEYTQGVTNGDAWKLLESYVGNSADQGGAGFGRRITFSNSDNTVRLQCNQNAALLYTQKTMTSLANPLTINATIQSGGLTAMALGVIAYSEKGDAPASYGTPSHTLNPTLVGGSNPVPTTALTSSTVYIANPPVGGVQINAGTVIKPATPKLGAISGDFDPASFTNLGANADADNLNGENDEDGIATFPQLSVLSTTYSVTATVGNTSGTNANLVGWIDFNRNGTFEASEGVAVVVPPGATTAVLTWTGLTGLIPGQSYARFRISTNQLDTSTPTTVISNGEVEDYTLPIMAAYDLAVTKTASVSPAVAGSPLSYTIKLTNNGPTTTASTDVIKVVDNLPADFTPTTYTAANGTYTPASGNWTGLTLASGQSTTLVIAGTVNATTTATSLSNTVTVTPPVGSVDPVTENNSATIVTPISRMVDLGLTKTASPKPAIAGQALTYTITLVNNGPSAIVASDVVSVVDVLPAGFTATSFTPAAGVYVSATANWTGLSLASGQSTTLTIAGSVLPTATGTLTNTATVVAPIGTTDPVPGNNVAIDNTTINRIIDFSLTKTATPKPAITGQGLAYTITLTNNGPGSLLTTDIVKVTDVLPAGFTATAYVPAAGSYDSATGNWTGLTLSNGQSVILTINGNVSASASTTLNNTATVTAPTGITDPVIGNNTATDATNISRVIDLGISKTATPKPAVAGQALSYVITLTNNGLGSLLAADVVKVTDALPAGFTATSYTAANGTYTSATGNWTGLTLASGQNTTLTIAGTLAATATGTLTNTANLTPPTGTVDNNLLNNVATDLTTVSRVVDLGISKTGSPKPVVAGQALTYTITLNNSGPSSLLAADVVKITDVLPVGFTANTYTVANGTYDFVTGNWTGLTLANGQSTTLTIAGTVGAGVTGSLTNSVSVAVPLGTIDPVPANNIATDVTNVNRSLDLALTKTASPKPVIAGQTLTYTITLTNNGPSTLLASDVISVVDNLPAGFTATSYTAAAGTYTSTNGNWTGLTLLNGQSTTLTIVGNVAATAGGTLNNTVSVTVPAGTTDPAPGNNTATDQTVVNRQIDFSISKTASPKPAIAGQALTYAITLTNNGPSALTTADVVKITDNLPAGFSASTYTPSSGTYDAATGNWTGLTLSNGQSVTLSIAGTVSATATGSLSNTVSITAPTGITDPATGNNSATDVTAINRVIDLGLTKTASPKPVVAGQTLTYTITLSNSGPSALLTTDLINLTDNLPAGFTATTYTAGTGTFNSANGNWTGLSLTTGQTTTLTIVGAVSATSNGTLTNTASVTGPTGATDPVSGNNSATDVTNIGRVIDLGITKTASLATAVAGQPLTYTITLTNNGVSSLLSTDVVKITETFPADFTASSYTPSTGTYSGVNWTGLSLGSGQSATLTIAGTVSATASGTLNNQAVLTPPTGTTDPVIGNNTATTATPVNRVIDFIITKTASPKPAVAGQALSYIITLQNNGPSTLTSSDVVKVVDNLPAGFTAATYTPLNGTYDNTTGNWTSLTLINGQSTTLTIAGTVAPGANGSLSNTAVVTPPAGITDPVTGNNTATDVTTISRIIDLGVSKTASPKPGVAGQPLTYTITLSNSGPGSLLPADVVTVVDNLPAGFTPTTYTVASGTYTSANGNWTGLSLANGQSTTLVIAGTLSATISGTLSNSVTLTPPTGTTDPVSTNNTATDQTVISRVIDFSIVKTAAPKPGITGQALTYTITLTNNGPSALVAADVVKVVDNVPTGFTAATFSPSVGTYDQPTDSWSGLTLANGQSAVLTITGIVDAAASGSLSNTATVTAPAGITDPVSGNNNSTDLTAITRSIDLSLSKTATPKPAVAGQALSYVITLKNNGTGSLLTSDVVKVVDNLPAGFTASTYTAATGTYNAGTGEWTGLNLTNGQTTTLTITGNVASTASGTLNNTATLTPPTGTTDPDLTNNTATDATVVNRVIDLGLSKTATPKPAVAGQALSYTITLSNNGPGALLTSDVVNVSDNLPAGFTANLYTASAGSYDSATGNWTGLTLASGQNVTLKIDGTISTTATGSLSNTVTLTPPAGTTDNVTGNNTATDVTTLNRIMDFGITKTATPKPVVAGESLTYTLTITNAGPSQLLSTDVLNVSDNLPLGFINPVYTAASGTYTSNNGNWTGLTLASGQSTTLTISGQTDPTLTGSLTNMATVTVPAGVNDPQTTNNTATDNTVVQNKPVLNITKTAPVDVVAGAVLTYTLTVTNTGSSTAINADITDAVPVALTNVSWTSSVSGTASVTSNPSGTGNNVNLNAYVPPGAGNTIVVTITGTVNPATPIGTISNTATVSPAEPLGTGGTSTATTTVKQTPVLTITKSGPSTGNAGAQVVYSLQVSNTGLSNSLNSVITDAIPAGLINVSWMATVQGNANIVSGATGTGPSVSITGNIPAGMDNHIDVVITGQIDPAFTGPSISNTATITPAEPGNPAVNSNTITTNITKTANLEITKTGPDNIVAGQAINYTIKLLNTGPSDATGINVTDIIPVAILNPSWTVTGTGSATSSVGSGTGDINIIAALKGNGADVLTISVTGILNAAFTGTTLSNTATATLPAGYTNSGTPVSSTATTTTATAANVRIVKSGPADIGAGQAIQYTLRVTNAGPSTAVNTVITDLLPAGIINATWTVLPSGGATIITPGTGTGNVNLTADVPTGSMVIVTINATVDAVTTDGTIISNTATANSSVPDPSTADNTSVFNTKVSNIAEFLVSKSGPATVNIGDPIVYKIVVSNLSPGNITAAKITDNVPLDPINVTSWTVTTSGGATTTVNGGIGNLISTIGDIPAGAGNTIEITVNGTVKATNLTVFTNTVTAEAGGTKTSSVTTSVNNSTDLSIVKQAPAQVAAGENISYTLKVLNNGPVDAQGLNIADAVPAGITNVSWTAVATGSATVTTGATGTGPNVAVTGDVASGGNNYILVTVNGLIPANMSAGSISNTATVSILPASVEIPFPVTDYNTANNSSTASTNIISNAALAVSKNGPSTAIAGEQISYQIKVSNNGTSDATDVRIADVLPTGLINVSWVPTVSNNASLTTLTPGVAYTTLPIAVNGGIPAGANNFITINVTATVDPGISVATINNTATANIGGAPDVLSNQVTTTISKVADLSVTNTVSPGSAKVGDQVVFTVTVRNNGPSNASNVQVSDLLPAGGFTLVSSVPGLGGYDPGTGTWLIGNLANGAQVTLTLTATVKHDANHQTTAVVSATESDPVTTNNTASAGITIINSNPVANPNAKTTLEDATLTVDAANGLLANASDVDLDALEISKFNIAGITGDFSVGTAVPIPGKGTITINSDGSYSFIPAPNYNDTDPLGVVPVITYTLIDGNGGTATSTLTINVTPVNDPPVFTKGPDQVLQQYAGAQVVNAWATGISAGPANESAQTVNFTLTNSDNTFFTVQPAIAPDGTLTYTPAPGKTGTVTVTVLLSDDGGTANGGQNTAAAQTFTITINPANPAITLTKAANNGGTKVGDVINYTLVAKNTGDIVLSGIVISDTGVDAGSITPASVASLAVGASATFTAKYTLTQTDVDAGLYSNQANVTAQDPGNNPVTDLKSDDPNTPAVDDPTVVTITPVNSTTLTKVVAPGTVITKAGDVINYTLVVTNTGNVTINQIIVTDPGADPGSLSALPASIAPGASATITAQHTVTQTEVDLGLFSNQARVESNSPNGIHEIGPKSDDPSTVAPDDPTIVVINPAPSIGLTKAINAGVVVAKAGDVINYTIIITNTGNVTLNNFVLTDAGADAGSIGSAPSVLAPGTSATLTAQHTLTQAEVDAGSFSNQASVTAITPAGVNVTNPASDDPNTLAANDPTVAVIAPSGSLSLTKVVVPGTVATKVGDVINYTLVIKNTGNITLNNMVLTDAGADAGSIGTVPSILTPGASATITAQHTLTQTEVDAGIFSNQASVSSTAPGGAVVSNPKSDDPSTPAVDDPTVFVISPLGAMTLTKTANNTGVKAGDVINYTLVVKNTGNVTLNNVNLTDSGVDGGLLTPQSIASLAPNASVTSTGKYTLTQADIDAGNYTNQASAGGLTPGGTSIVVPGSDDPATATPNDPTVIIIVPASSMTLTKAVAAGTTVSKAGDVINYSIVITNTGTVTISNLVLTDPGADAGSIGAVPSTLAPGASVTVTAKHTVIQAEVDAGLFSNQAAVAGTTPAGTAVFNPKSDDPATPAIDDPTIVTIAPSGAFSLTKETAAGTNVSKAGDVITYNILIKNTGNITLGNLVLTDAGADAGSIGSVPATLAPGASVTVTLKHTLIQSEVDAGSFSNQAGISGTTPGGAAVSNPTSDDPSTAAPNDPTVVVITPAGSMSLTKTAGNTGSKAGDVINYTLVVTNTGNVTLNTVEVWDMGTDAGSINPASIASLAPGASATVTAKHTLTQADVDAGTFSNQASVSSKTPGGTPVITPKSDDPNTPAPDDATVITIVPLSAMTLTKVANNTGTKAGDIIEYTLILTNTGNSTLNAIAVTDPGADVGSISPATVATLVPNASATVTAKHTLTQADVDAGIYSNQAGAAGTTTGGTPVLIPKSDDPAKPGTEDPTVVNITPAGTITLTKVAVNTGAKAGDVINYNLVVTNSGNVTLNAITVADPGADAGSITPATIASLAVGASTTVTAKHTLTQTEVDAGVYSNQANVSGTSPGGSVVTNPKSDDPNTPALNDPTVSVITPAGSMSLTKVANNSGSKAGDVINYTLVVTNTGNVTLNGIAINDAGADAGSISPSTIASLAVGASASVTAVHTLTQADVDAGTYSNQASVEGNTPGGIPVMNPKSDDPNTPAPDDATVITITPVSSMSLTKLANNAGVNAGDVINYTLVVTNTGGTTLSAIAVADAGADTGSITPASIATLAPGASATVTAKHTLTQANVDAGQYSNQASVTGTAPGGAVVSNPKSDDPSTPAVDDPTVVTITPVSSIALTKVAQPGTVVTKAGDVITYNLEVKNTGNVNLTNLVLTDAGAGSITPASIANLAPGANATATARHTVTQAEVDAGQYSNQASITGATPNGGVATNPKSDDPTTPAVDDPTVTTISPAGAMSLTKVANNTGTKAGDVINYTLMVTNTGNVTLNTIKVTDAGADAGSITPSTLANLAVGASATVTASHILTQADIDAGMYSNQAGVEGNTPGGTPVINPKSDDPNTPSPDDATIITIPPVTSMKLTKQANNTGAKAGDVISYSIIVTNTGNVTLNTIKVTDAGADAGSITPATITALAPNASATVMANHSLTQTEVDAGLFSNQASVEGTSPDGTVVTNPKSDDPSTPAVDDPTIITITPAATLGLTKAAVAGTVVNKAGDVISYNLVVTNTGNVTLSNVAVTDAGADAGSIMPASIANLAPGASAAVSAKHTLTQAEVDNGNYSNQASVAGVTPGGIPAKNPKSDDPSTPVADDPTVVAIVPAGSLTLTKVAGNTGAKAGDVISYTLVLTNTGNVTLSNVVVADAGADAGSITPANVASLAVGASATVIAKHTLTQTEVDNGSYSNQASATGTTPGGNPVVKPKSDDPNTPTPDDATVITVASNAGVALVKTAALAADGNTITYTFRIINTGNVTLNTATLNDAKLGISRLVALPGGLAPGASVSTTEVYTLTTADRNTGNVTNTANVAVTTVKGDNATDISGTDATNDNATVTDVPQIGVISLIKTASFSGNKVTYTFTIKNGGNVNLNTITLSDAKLGLSNLPVAVPGGLIPNAIVSITQVYTLTQQDKDAGKVTNTATVNALTPGLKVVTDVSGTAENNNTPTEITVPKSPVAFDDKAEAKANQAVIIKVLANDDPGSSSFDNLTVQIITQPQHGKAVVNSDGSITYTPDPGYTGPDSFTYNVKDLYGYQTNTATVTLGLNFFDITIPNLFTPNGDGINDTFEIRGLNQYGANELTIVNRWGNEVFRQNNYQNTWTGEGLNEGTYYYLLKVTRKGSTDTQVFKGYITLVRAFKK
ncbi:Ig-like domain-containing protein [Pedobacter nototheniae]|uniref:DUF7507 domain-containing protein n=1 Tax=Pedobacter nototheniae TaxID=2488994 RepID=UPI00292EB05B|nr:gliding motility-associated C-terminal domain-containing protein [Pedobacter nototheniae]